jgi:Flp pilus assembly protein CpaB
MKRLIMTAAALGAAASLAACGADASTEPAASDTATVADTLPTATVTAAAADWPKGTRIVEENGVTYRVDPAGTRVALGDNGWRIVTDNGTR